MNHDLREIFPNFKIYGDFISAEPYGSGHINDTYLLKVSQAGRIIKYIFQRINHKIFTDPELLMDNIRRVTEQQHSKLENSPDQSRKALSLIMSKDDKSFFKDISGNFWRAYFFVENAATYDIVETAEQAYQAAYAFGEFQKILQDMPGEKLNETIPDFHNTPKRIDNLNTAVENDIVGKVSSVKKEIDFVGQYEKLAGQLIKLNQEGKIPERITHNDTKLNNVMLDDHDASAVCVIDLDTVMPGFIGYDFGDMVRTSTSPAAEDETELDKIFIRKNMFFALIDGYLDSAGSFMNTFEKETLITASKIILLETGVRFLTDHIQGDKYFKIHRPSQNSDRCRAQFKLLKSIEDNETELYDYLCSK